MKYLGEKINLCLKLLADAGETYGLQIVAASDGTLTRGSIYVMLGRLEKQNFVYSRRQDRRSGMRQGIPLRLYGLTDQGRQYVEAVRAFEAISHASGTGANPGKNAGSGNDKR